MAAPRRRPARAESGPVWPARFLTSAAAARPGCDPTAGQAAAANRRMHRLRSAARRRWAADRRAEGARPDAAAGAWPGWASPARPAGGHGLPRRRPADGAAVRRARNRAMPPPWSPPSNASASPTGSRPAAARSWCRPIRCPRLRLMLAREGLPSGGSVGYEIFDRSDGLAATRVPAEDQRDARAGGRDRPHHPRHRRHPRRARASRAAAPRAVRARSAGRAGQRDAHHAGRPAGPRGHPGDPQPGLRRGAWPAAAEHRHRRRAAICWRAPASRSAHRGADPRGGAARARTAAGRAVEEMLERSLGAGHVRAEAAVRMSFDRRETRPRNATTPTARSPAARRAPPSRTTAPTGAITVQNNLPNADAAPGAGARRHGRRRPPTTRSAGAHADPRAAADEAPARGDGRWLGELGDGKHAGSHARPEELDRITGLVKSAIGFDEKRGDHVEVVSMRFADEAPRRRGAAGLLGMPFDKAIGAPGADRAVGPGGAGALLVCGRWCCASPPAWCRCRRSPGRPEPWPARRWPAAGRRRWRRWQRPSGGRHRGPAARRDAAGYPGAARRMLEDESMVNIAQIEGQMRASSLRRIGAAGREASGGDAVDHARLDGAGEQLRC